jgi:uncharacterized protein YdeI (YjbR/CyaY-like superfamily)
MDITETLYVPTREGWRAWLDAHHESKTEIWLVSYRKHAGRPSVSYGDAVEEALCFGWIDGTRKGLDGERYAQRFTPRRSGSGYSQTNKERLARLLAEGRVHPSVEAGLGDVRPEAYEISGDIQAALQADEDAWAFFQTTPPAYQRIRAAYVDHARGQPAEFENRLKNLVAKSAPGERFGYGIEGFY